MNLDTTRVPENSLGSLNICLLEGDPQQQRRARNIRRRAILFSVVFQTIAVTALIVFPLLGKGERPSTKICLPLPPYRFGSPQPAGETGSKDPARDQSPCFFCKDNLTPGLVVLHHPGGVNSSDPGLPPGIDGPAIWRSQRSYQRHRAATILRHRPLTDIPSRNRIVVSSLPTSIHPASSVASNPFIHWVFSCTAKLV